MPGNTVQINGSEVLEWYVGDSRMVPLIEYLDWVGIRMTEKERNEIEEEV